MFALSFNDFAVSFFHSWNEYIMNHISSNESEHWSEDECINFLFSNGGVIEATIKKIQNHMFIKYIKGIYGFDACIVSKRGFYEGHLNRPTEIHAVIEYANINDVEEKMWKLVHWRAPLKVLIFSIYVTTEDEINQEDCWVNEKLDNLRNIRDRVSDFNVESATTDYLVLVCLHIKNRNIPVWYYASENRRRLKFLTCDGVLDRAREIAADHNKVGTNYPMKISINLEANQSFEDSIGMHGALEVKINAFMDSLQWYSMQIDRPLLLESISYKASSSVKCQKATIEYLKQQN